MAEVKHIAEKQHGVDTTITFPNGLLGFTDCRRFRLVHQTVGAAVVYTLESLDRSGLAFTLIDPAQFDLTYDLTLSDEEQALLEATTADDVAVFLMLARGEDEAGGLHANIAGPLVINVASRKGLQKVLVRVGCSVNLAAAG